MNSDNIIQLPAYDDLLYEVDQLRGELARRIQERDELRYLLLAEIEGEYLRRVGSLEYRVCEAKCESQRLKRKIELVQAALNRREKPDLSRIERRLDLEFAEALHSLEDQEEKIRKAEYTSEMQRSATSFRRDVTGELYRTIVMFLHPELNPEANDAEQQLFYLAVTAYKNEDLDALRVIYEMLGQRMPPAQSRSGVKKLCREKERLESSLRSVKEELTQLRSEYPYTLRELLADPGRLAGRKAELNALLSQLKMTNALYRARIGKMLSGRTD